MRYASRFPGLGGYIGGQKEIITYTVLFQQKTELRFTNFVEYGCLMYNNDSLDFLCVCDYVSIFISDINLDILSVTVSLDKGLSSLLIFSNIQLFVSLIQCICSFCFYFIDFRTQFDYFLLSAPPGHACFFLF